METQTRPLTFDEMYFKKASKLPLSIPAAPSVVTKPILEPGGLLHESAIPETPAIDLSKPVFPSVPFTERAVKFINKNLVWILLGTGVVVGTLLWYRNQQKKKDRNSQHGFPNC